MSDGFLESPFNAEMEIERRSDLGQFAIPMNVKELIFQLSNGVACEWPAHFGWQALRNIQCCTSASRLVIEQIGFRIYITPESITLNEQGKALLSVVNIEQTTAEQCEAAAIKALERAKAILSKC